MARPRKKPEEKRTKWPVLNITPAERAAITAAAGGAGLGINDYILACTRQTRLVRRGDREHMVRHLAGIEARLDEIARQAMVSSLPTRDVASLLLALRGVEAWLRTGHLALREDADVPGGMEC